MNSKHETSAPGGQPRAELGMSQSDSVLESFLVWPLAAAALAGKANVRFLEDLMSSVSGTQEEAQKSAENLKARYPLLQVKVYDAAAPCARGCNCQQEKQLSPSTNNIG